MNTKGYSSKKLDDLQKEYRKLEKEKYDFLDSIKEKQDAITKLINDKKSEEDKKILLVFKKNIEEVKLKIGCICNGCYLNYDEKQNTLYIRYTIHEGKETDSVRILYTGVDIINKIDIVIRYHYQIYLNEIIEIIEVIKDYIIDCKHKITANKKD